MSKKSSPSPGGHSRPPLERMQRLHDLLANGRPVNCQQLGREFEVSYKTIQRDLDFPSGMPNLASARYLFEAAEYVAQVSLAVQQAHQPVLAQSGVSGEATLMLGGQIQGQPHGLIMIYPQGNYITACDETPYLQIGESKYGKPVLERVVHPGLSLEDGARLCLVSLDATARSNATVGPPFEVIIYPRDRLQIAQYLKYPAEDPYWQQVQTAWNEGLRRAFNALPRLPWEADGGMGDT